jgi:hypothetical protein
MTRQEFDAMLRTRSVANAALYLEIADKMDIRARINDELGLHDDVTKALVYAGLAMEYRLCASEILKSIGAFG